MHLSPRRNDGNHQTNVKRASKRALTTAALMLSFCGHLKAPAQAFSSVGGTPPASLPIKDTDYAIPNGAVFAAPSNTADLASGSTSSLGKDTNAGTLASPWTLTKALSSSPDGATIVLRGGNYRALNLSFSRRNTVQAYPHEKPWMRGDLVVPPAEFSANGALTAAPLVFCAGDATVQDGSSAGSTGTTGTNYGNATELAVKTSGGTGLNRDAYLKFGLNFTTNVTRARLRFYAKSSDASTVGTNLYSVATTNWIETGSNSITWSNKPARSSTAWAASMLRARR